MNRAVSTTSCVAAPAVRVTRVRLRVYLSLEDSLMRIFASERVKSLMQKLGMKEGEAIEHPVNKAIENAQRKVEGATSTSAKQLLEYDDVANDQRKGGLSAARRV